MSINFEIVDNQVRLHEIIPNILSENDIFIDLEFVRKSTYWPVLGLVQIATQDIIYIVDAVHVDMDDLRPIFENPHVKKWFYSAKQDLEILYKIYGFIPENIQDLQVAITFQGGGDHVGLGKAVKAFLNEDMDKTSQFSDWVKRPLTDAQYAYAAMDVECIRNLCAPVMEGLKSTGNETWYDYFMCHYCDEETFHYAKRAVKKLCSKVKNPKKFYILDAITTRRENLAAEYDKPRQHILPDLVLEGIAETLPETFADFKSVIFDKKRHNKPLRPNAHVFKDLYHVYTQGLEALKTLGSDNLEAYIKTRLDIFHFTEPQHEAMQTMRDHIAKLSSETGIPACYLTPSGKGFHNLLLGNNQTPPWFEGLPPSPWVLL